MTSKNRDKNYVSCFCCLFVNDFQDLGIFHPTSVNLLVVSQGVCISKVIMEGPCSELPGKDSPDNKRKSPENQWLEDVFPFEIVPF